MHIKSDNEDLIIFLITRSGFVKSKKWLPWLYVSTEITTPFFLSKNTSSFRLREDLFDWDNFKKYLSEDIQLTNLDKVFQVIVKSAIFEFLYKPKVSTKIIIKEYLDASNFFLEDGQTKYLNAILDKIAKKIRTANAWIWINKKLFSKTF